MISSPVLVLNQNYEPLNICTVRRAVVLLGVGKAETLENAEGEISTASYAMPIPSVIRLMYMIRRPVLQRRLSRREIFLRDKYTCLYCGRGDEAAYPGPRRAAIPGRGAHLGERGQRLHNLQPPEGPGARHRKPGCTSRRSRAPLV